MISFSAIGGSEEADGMNQKRWQKWMIDYLFILAGTAIYALGVHMFTVPNQIAPGGVTGLATAFNALTGIPIGLFSAIVNVPLVLLGLKFLGKAFILKTLVSTLSFTLMVDVLFARIPAYHGDTLLAAIFGGAMIGLGIALTFVRNGSTGGTDITSQIIRKKFPQFPIGKIVLLSDLVIISFATFVFRNLESALYAVISMFICSKVIDGIIYGLDLGKMVLIVSDHCNDISKAIISELGRGGTFLPAKGAYSGESREVLLCALRNNEFYKVKRLVNQLDPKAFIIVTNAGEVLGEGFKKIDG